MHRIEVAMLVERLPKAATIQVGTYYDGGPLVYHAEDGDGRYLGSACVRNCVGLCSSLSDRRPRLGGLIIGAKQ